MKINCINFYNKATNFKSQSTNTEATLGYGDDISKMRRERIRKDIYEKTMPNQDIFEREGRLEEYEMNKLVGSLLGTKVNSRNTPNPKEINANKIDSNLMYQLSAYNIEPIYETNSWRGGVSDLGKKDLEILKKAGIKTIIPLAGTRFSEKHCEDEGLNCFRYCTARNIFDNDAFKTEAQVRREELEDAEIFGLKPNVERALKIWEENKRHFINNFVKFIQTMQSENVYIGCEFGTDSTNNALLLNHFFNPKAKDTKIYMDNCNKFHIDKLTNLAANLTPEDKKAIGWDEEFEENTLAEIKECSDW